MDNFVDERLLQKENLKKTTDTVSIFCIAGFLVNILLGFLIKIFGLNKNFIVYMISMAMVSVISILCVSLVCAKFCGGMKTCIDKYEKKTGLLDNVLLVILGFGGCMTVNFILDWISMFIPLPAGGSDMSFFENTDMYSTIFTLIAVAVAPPICEELAFRGFAMGSLSDFGQGFAVLFSSIFFGMMHSGVWGILFAFMVGFLLGCIRKTSGSLVPSMVVHFLNNVYSVGIIVFVQTFGIELYADVSTVFVYCMCGLFLVMAFVVHKRNIGFFAFSSGECILTKSKKAKIVFTRPLFWIFAAFSVTMTVLSVGAAHE